MNSVRCLIIKGAGNKAFVAGADISDMMSMSKAEAKAFSEFGNNVFDSVEMLPIPVIAEINGYALGGGCELALACDIRICSTKSKFGQPETSLGIIPGFGGTKRLSRVIGVSKSKELIFSGNIVDAEEALNIGLVNKVCDEDDLEAVVINFAERVLKNSSFAISKAKMSIDYYINNQLNGYNQFECQCFSETFDTDDQINRMKLFLENRKG